MELMIYHIINQCPMLYIGHATYKEGLSAIHNVRKSGLEWLSVFDYAL